MSTLSYLKNLAKDKNIASITPTSAFGVARVCRNIDFRTGRVFVEYGPGGGVFTRYLLSRMRPDAKLIAIEANSSFARDLSAKLADKRLSIHHDSAGNVLNLLAERGEQHADYIISGIPFSLFSPALKDAILAATKQALGERGSFLVYQFFISLNGPKSDIRKKLSEHLHIVRTDFELLNVPPLRIFEARNGISLH